MIKIRSVGLTAVMQLRAIRFFRGFAVGVSGSAQCQTNLAGDELWFLVGIQAVNVL